MSDNNNFYFIKILHKSWISKSNCSKFNAEIKRDIYIKWLNKCKFEKWIK